MASVQKITLFSGSVSSNSSGSAVSLEGLQDDFVGFLDITAIGAGTTATVKIERSPNGSDWFDWINFSAANSVGKQLKDATAPGLSYARMTISFMGPPTVATMSVTLSFDKKSK